MEKKRYLIEIGIGVDMHGANMTKAAVKAVNNALSHCCMAGIVDIHHAGPENIALKIKISCPKPEQLDLEKVKEPVNFYKEIEIETEKGGAYEYGLHVPEMGEGNTLNVAIAIITVYLKNQ